MNIYAGNLSREVTVEDVRHAFEGFGQVAGATIIRDKKTVASRGFGFVEMPSKAEADAAISGLNGKELKGQPIVVNEARPESRRGGTRLGGGYEGGRRVGSLSCNRVSGIPPVNNL